MGLPVLLHPERVVGMIGVPSACPILLLSFGFLSGYLLLHWEDLLPTHCSLLPDCDSDVVTLGSVRSFTSIPIGQYVGQHCKPVQTSQAYQLSASTLHCIRMRADIFLFQTLRAPIRSLSPWLDPKTWSGLAPSKSRFDIVELFRFCQNASTNRALFVKPVT